MLSADIIIVIVIVNTIHPKPIASLVSNKSRVAVQAAESSWAAREAILRREVGRLEAHIHNLQSEKAELSVSASEATKPLLR